MRVHKLARSCVDCDFQDKSKQCQHLKNGLHYLTLEFAESLVKKETLLRKSQVKATVKRFGIFSGSGMVLTEHRTAREALVS